MEETVKDRLMLFIKEKGLSQKKVRRDCSHIEWVCEQSKGIAFI